MPSRSRAHAARRTSAVVLAAGALIGASALPAVAASTAFDDPTGDASGGLDVTHVKVANRDSAVVADITLTEVRRGHVLLSLDRRSGPGRTILASRKADGSTSSRLVQGSFSDNVFGKRVPCSGLRATWDVKSGVVHLRMPSTCLDGGNYGALRAVVLTERPGGGDSDVAPGTIDQDAVPWTEWIPRG